MFALDLFNTDHERRLAEGAVDQLEQRRIDDLAMKMDDLVARAKEPAYKKNPGALAALMKEFKKCKDERDSYYKIRNETVGYGGLTSEAGIPGNVPTEKIPGKEDLLKGKGRSYYEGADEDKAEIRRKIRSDIIDDKLRAKMQNAEKAKAQKKNLKVAEQSNPEQDDWYDDEDDRLRSGDYVRDQQDGESGEIFRMQGDPYERRVRILDRDGKGWYIEPSRLTRVDPQDPDVQRYFGKQRVRDMDEGINEGLIYSGDTWQDVLYRINMLNDIFGDQRDLAASFEPASQPEWIPFRDRILRSRTVLDTYAKVKQLANMNVPLTDVEIEMLDDVAWDGGGGPVEPAGHWGERDYDWLEDLYAQQFAVVQHLLDQKAQGRGQNKTKSGQTVHEQGVAEAIVASGPSKPLDDRAVKKMVWDTMKINADTGEQALQRALAVLAKKPQSRMVQDLQDKFQSLADRLAQGVAEAVNKKDLVGRLQKDLPKVNDSKNKDSKAVNWTGPGKDDYGYTGYKGHGMPTDRQERTRIRADKNKGVAEGHERGSKVQHPKYGAGQVVKVYPNGMISVNFPEYLAPMSKNPGVTGNFNPGDSDYQSLKSAMAEGWSDAMVARRTGGPRTPYSVYINGRKWKDFENDDHARAVADKLRAKFKADGRDPSTITIAPTDYDQPIKEEQDTSGVERAILNRIMVAHTDLLMKFGPDKVMQAAEEVAYNVGDVDEIGTSDVSAYVHQVKQILGAA